jgi:hypothetical protein
MLRAGFEPTIQRFRPAEKTSHGLDSGAIFIGCKKKLREFVIETHGNEIKTDEKKMETDTKHEEK